MAPLVSLARSLRSCLSTFDPALLSGTDCAALVSELAATEKACAAARALAAARAASCGAHRELGFGDAAEWLSRQAGTSRAEAQAALDTADALDGCPDTKQALVSGALSLAQASEIVRTEAVSPGSEEPLLAIAARLGLGALREEARRRRLEAADRGDLRARQMKARTFRTWTDELGMLRIRGALLPEHGAAFVSRLDAHYERVRRIARREGRDDERAALYADAFVELVSGSGNGRSRSADVVFVCDLTAYRRGHRHEGEASHVVGGGPVPVSVIRETVADDAFLKVVLHDGKRIDTVVHLGRHIPAELRTALELGAAPEFLGTQCVEEGCGKRSGLEFDHVDPVANNGQTSFANLQPRCRPHHRDKTERDRLAGLLGGGGRRGPPT